MLSHMDLFAGIGGFSLGLQWAGGYETVALVEIEPYCQQVLTKHFPTAQLYPDVRTVTYEQLRADGIVSVDILTGGFPCQPVSTAGNQRGKDDTRWLWSEFVRCIRTLRPQWVLAENVPGLRSIDTGRLFGTVLSDLAEIGYDAEWYGLGAVDIGAWHKRERVWIVAYPASSGWRAGLSEQKDISERQWHTERAEQSGSGGKYRSSENGTPMANPCSPRRSQQNVCGQFTRRAETFSYGKVVSDTQGKRCRETRPDSQRSSQWFTGSSEVSNSTNFNARYQDDGESPRLAQFLQQYQRHFALWHAEPNVGRVADGIPRRVDRLRALGNAIVPQIAQIFGEAIMAYELNSEYHGMARERVSSEAPLFHGIT